MGDFEPFNRRVFIQRLTFLGGGAVLFWGCSRKGNTDGGAALGGALTSSHHSFLDDDYAVVGAACERILPKDDDPGALEAGVPEYIDRMLQSPELARMREDFIQGTAHLQKRARRMYKKGFAELNGEQQDTLLRLFRESAPGSGEAHYFELLMTLTLEGYLGDPSYGGNKNRVGWALVGFQVGEPLPGHAGMGHGVKGKP